MYEIILKQYPNLIFTLADNSLYLGLLFGAFGILGEQAEYVKINHGSCYPIESQKNEVVVVPGLPNRTPKEISLFGISQVIQARMEDIIERIQYELSLSGYDGKLPGGLIITGGGSSLKNITQLFSFRLGMDVNLGVPNQHLGKGLTDEVKSPIFATGIGLVLKGFEITESTEEQMNHKIHKETEAAASQAAEEMEEAELEEVEANKAGFSSGIKNLFSGSWGLTKGIRDWMEDGEDDFEND